MRRPAKSAFHLPRTIRTRDGKPSAYTLADSPSGQGYVIRKDDAPRWESDGYHITSAAFDDEPPAYVLAEVERQQSADFLLGWLRPARVERLGRDCLGYERNIYHHSTRSRVGVVQRSVSSSGMFRHLSLYATSKGGDIFGITSSAALVLREPVRDFHGYDTIGVSGCGMDMHFSTVYNLAHLLYGDGYLLDAHTL